jgi:hypothetical protein
MDAEMDILSQELVSLAVERDNMDQLSLTEDPTLRPQHAMDVMLLAMSVQVKGQPTADPATRIIISPILTPQIKLRIL